MCGIYGILMKKQKIINKKIFNSLKLLEYRGYDSSGIFYYKDGIKIIKSVGKIKQLEEKTTESIKTNIILGHTRWATHGIPNYNNSHPHISLKKKLVIVHNGIIENYIQLKNILLDSDYTFYGTTDTEILVNYIEFISTQNVDLNFEEILKITFNNITGSFSCILFNSDYKNQLFILKKDMPLLLGKTNNSIEISSDIICFDSKVKTIIDINNNSLCVLKRDSIVFTDLINNTNYIPIEKEYISNNIGITKENYKHFMLKEIINQESSIKNCLMSRIKDNIIFTELGTLEKKKIKKIIICACGSSHYASMIGKYIIEELTSIEVIIEQASEYRYRKRRLNTKNNKNTLMIVVSQSGETADTIGALRYYKGKGPILSICNVLHSSISKESTYNINLNIGPEIGVASTKSFTSQMMVFYMLGLWFSNLKNNKILQDLKKIPTIYDTFIPKMNIYIENLAKKYFNYKNILYIARGYNYPIVLEAALKMKEISYIHAEGFLSSELKHGPLALIDEKMLIICIVLKDYLYEKTISNIKEVKSRKGILIGIVDEDNHELDELFDSIIRVPKIAEQLYPLLTIIPLQLLSYYIANENKCSIDQPKNLAKCVTVE